MTYSVIHHCDVTMNVNLHFCDRLDILGAFEKHIIQSLKRFSLLPYILWLIYSWTISGILISLRAVGLAFFS